MRRFSGQEMVAGPETFAHVALQAVGAVLATLIAFHACAAKRVTGSRALGRFAVAFALFALAQAIVIAEGIHLASARVIRASAPDLFDVWFWGYYAALLIGWGALLTSFSRPKFRWVLAVAPLLLFAGPIAQLISILLSFLVVIHAGLNHIERAGPGSLRTAIGFFLLFVAQCAFLLDYLPLAPRNFAGEIANGVGLALLYAAIRWPRGGD